MTKLVKFMKSLAPEFIEYEAVLEKVAHFSAPLWQKFQEEINCKKGCVQCCTAGLTLLPVEAAYIQRAIQAHSVRPPASKMSDAHCDCLDEEGLCTIYAYRPLVCRTHGLPLKVADGDLKKAPASLRILGEDTFTCTLNFGSGNKPAASDVLDTDKLHRLLWVVNARFCAAQKITDPNGRIPMNQVVTALTQEGDDKGS